MFAFRAIFSIILLFCLQCESLYEKYKLYRVQYQTKHNLANLINLKKMYSEEYDIWKIGQSPHGLILMTSSPKGAENLTNFINSNNMTFDVVMDDLNREIEKENALSRVGRTINWRKGTRRRNHEYYKTYDEIIEQMHEIAQSYPFVTLETLGKTVEERDIKGLSISIDPSKPIIWIDAGIHAREWIAPATALYIIDRIITRSGKPLLEKYQFYIIPLVNPDGYAYSHEKDRLWRKNRKVYAPHTCAGVDLNRNFPFQWAVGTGSSTDECNQEYRGPSAASELETQSLIKKLTQLKDKIILYLTFHSFGQYIIVPFGFSTKYVPYSQAKMFEVANSVKRKIQEQYGFRYKVGSAPTILYLASGASDDYAAGALNVKYSYTIELLDEGAYGFVLPSAYIRPTGRQMWTGMKEFARQLENER